MLGATENPVGAEELLNWVVKQDGLITQYYGRIGNGKTYVATSEVLRYLSEGRVVYTNWKLNYEGYDSRNSFWYIVLSLLWPLPLRFVVYPKDNLKYIETDESFISRFEKLTDCAVFLDEGHVVFDSYQMAKMNLRDRKAVLHTRHFDREIIIISQRPTAVHVSLRANVNRFYKCELILKFWFILWFRKTEYQDMSGETVDEEQPIASKWIFGKKKVLNAYDSKYLRGNTPSSQKLHVEAYRLNYGARLVRLGRIIARAWPFGHKPAQGT